jgi:hypothetical protein
MGKHLSIDETTFSQGELYTIVTNKEAKGKKGSLVAMVREIKAYDVILLLSKLPRSLPLKVKEITLDLPPTMLCYLFETNSVTDCKFPFLS